MARKHHSEDYKLYAVKHYLTKSRNYRQTCKEFDCNRISLYRWVTQYKTNGNLKRRSRSPISYRVTDSQVKTALKILKDNQHITMKDLLQKTKDIHENLTITSQHLGKIVRDNNRTRKRTRHKHFPKTRYGKTLDRKEELRKFYSVTEKQSLGKIICLDETSVSPLMIKEYSRCFIGKRCVFKTDDSYIYRKFTLLVAINSKGCVGYELYEKGGMTKERLVQFLNKFVFEKYKSNLIILDNAGSHSNEYVKKAIRKSGNAYLYSVPYTPQTNAIECFFSQLKSYLKLNPKVNRFPELKEEIKRAIDKVTPENYKNYFRYAYRKKKTHKPTTSKRALRRKVYKK